MKVAAYCRVSTDKSDQLNSLEMQKQFFFEFTERNNHTLVKLYADEGISGTKIKNRKQFQKLMQDAHSGLFDLVVVKDISRFARNTVDFLQSIRALKALGVETIFLTANMTVLGGSEFVLTIFGALAQEESANTSKRIKFGKRINAEKGRVPNLVFGYDKQPGDYFHLHINRREAAVVRQIFSLYTEEQYGTAKIAEKLNEAGHHTKRGCAWTQNAVCRILSNALYTGLVLNGKQEVQDFLTGARADRAREEWLQCERPALRIIEMEQFVRAQRIRSARSGRFAPGGRRPRSRYPFSGLIHCRECGSAFRRTVRSYKNTYVRWVCASHNGSAASCANAVMVDEHALVGVLEHHLGELLCGSGGVRAAQQALVKQLAGAQSTVQKQRGWRKELEELRRRRQRYLDLYADELMTREELQRSTAGMREDMAALEECLRRQDGERTERELWTFVEQVVPDAAALAAVGEMTAEELRELLWRIEVDRHGNVDIFFQPLHCPKTVPFCDSST